MGHSWDIPVPEMLSCSDLGCQITQPAAQNKTAGTVTEGPLMDKPIERDRDAFTRHQTIERYRRLLTTIADRNHRKRLLELIAEEQQKQRDARDPKYLY
jgi:hypothetical protein